MTLESEQELRAVLTEYEESLAQVEQLLQQQPRHRDAVQVKADLGGAIQLARDALTALASVSEPTGTDQAAVGAPRPDTLPESSPDEAAAAPIGPALPPGLLLDASERPAQADQPASGPCSTSGRDTEEQRPAKRLRTAVIGSGGGKILKPANPRTGNNSRMHPANMYAQRAPDFAALARKHPALQPHCKFSPDGSATIGFSSSEASKAVTQALLKEDYSIEWDLPPGQLIPAVTNRANYIHWVADLLRLSSPPSAGQVRGLDIGCGANLIYPLLGAAIHGWAFVGADITDAAAASARRNAARNPHLAELIEVRLVSPADAGADADVGGTPATNGLQAEAVPALHAAVNGTACIASAAAASEDVDRQRTDSTSLLHSDQQQAAWQQRLRQQRAAASDTAGHQSFGVGQPILLPAVAEGEAFSFSMCNPPFFESIAEAGLNPHTAHGGTAEEMVYPGGELAFVSQMVEDSAVLGRRIHWYTSMVGKKASLKALRRMLHARRITALRTTEFCQGRTSRWGIAWSFAVDPNLASTPLTRGSSLCGECMHGNRVVSVLRMRVD